MKVKYRKTLPLATMDRATDGSAGFDLTVCKIVVEGSMTVVDFGITIEIPKGHMGLLVERSSTAKRYNLSLANKIGIIDSDYRGPVKGQFEHKLTHVSRNLALGDKIAQLVIVPITKVELVEDYKNTEKPSILKSPKKKSGRGVGGFGSTDEEEFNKNHE